MRFRPPLRLRLTLWYTTVMGIILLLFAGFLYWQVRRQLYARMDAGLQLAAGQALFSVALDDGQPAFQVDAGGRDALGEVGDDLVIYLRAADGRVLGAISSEDQPAMPPAPAGHSTLPVEGEPWRVYTQPLPPEDGSGFIMVAQELDPLQAILAGLRAQFLWGLPLALVLSGIGGYFLASRALAPIDQMTRTARQVSAGDMGGRIRYQGPADEVGRLAATFDDMLDRLQAAFERERRFTADAAHELRTPLAALKGRIGVTLSQSRRPLEYEDTLRSLETEVDRLIRLSKDLLFIARLDQGQISPTLERIEVGELLALVVSQLRPLAAERSITLEENSSPGLVVSGDVRLLIRLFLNLLDNAVKFSPNYGRVIISAQQAAGRVEVVIRDNGPGIAREHLPHLFERFFRGEGSRGRGGNSGSEGGSGLGLAIAYEIAWAHDGVIEVESEPGKGATFVVRIPAIGS